MVTRASSFLVSFLPCTYITTRPWWKIELTRYITQQVNEDGGWGYASRECYRSVCDSTLSFIGLVTDAANMMRLSHIFHKLSEFERSFGETFVCRILFNLLKTDFDESGQNFFSWSCTSGFHSSQTDELTTLTSDRLYISITANDGSSPEADPLLLWLKWRAPPDIQAFIRLSEKKSNFILTHCRPDVSARIPLRIDLDVAKFALFCRFLWLNRGPRLGTHAQTMPRSTSRNDSTRVFTWSTKKTQSEASY